MPRKSSKYAQKSIYEPWLTQPRVEFSFPRRLSSKLTSWQLDCAVDIILCSKKSKKNLKFATHPKWTPFTSKPLLKHLQIKSLSAKLTNLFLLLKLNSSFFLHFYCLEKNFHPFNVDYLFYTDILIRKLLVCFVAFLVWFQSTA